jgi:glycosyltransferase involved in cell wall biosynthesis
MSTEEQILAGTAALVPAYNAAAHIAGVLDRIKKVIPSTRIIVVDDGSTDDTYREASSGGVNVIQHPLNRGKGAALTTGFKKALNMGLDYVVTLDADGQHDPAEIHKFVRRFAETGADIVVGNRFGDLGEMPWIRKATNRTTSAVTSFFAKQKIPDSQNGYRMISTRVLAVVDCELVRYEAESELLIKAGKKGFKVESVPVETIYGDEVSAIHPVVDTARFFRLVYKALFW